MRPSRKDAIAGGVILTNSIRIHSLVLDIQISGVAHCDHMLIGDI